LKKLLLPIEQVAAKLDLTEDLYENLKFALTKFIEAKSELGF
jgi:hypothetical protein